MERAALSRRVFVLQMCGAACVPPCGLSDCVRETKKKKEKTEVEFLRILSKFTNRDLVLANIRPKKCCVSAMYWSHVTLYGAKFPFGVGSCVAVTKSLKDNVVSIHDRFCRKLSTTLVNNVLAQKSGMNGAKGVVGRSFWEKSKS